MVDVAVRPISLIQSETRGRKVSVQLVVRDEGPGIPEEEQERIFEPYYTTKKQGKGSGLGLSVVEGIVDSLGGSISVDSQRGGGAAFIVRLPATEQLPLEAETRSPQMVLTGTERILIVDDEPEMCRINRERLVQLGYCVTVAHNGEDALQLFQQSPDDFDLVISDQVMPGMSGTELIEIIWQKRPELPVILCTGYSTPSQWDKLRRSARAVVVTKPVDRDPLVGHIRALLDLSPEVNSPSGNGTESDSPVAEPLPPIPEPLD